jgi:hypothetical protein
MSPVPRFTGVRPPHIGVPLNDVRRAMNTGMENRDAD